MSDQEQINASLLASINALSRSLTSVSEMITMLSDRIDLLENPTIKHVNIIDPVEIEKALATPAGEKVIMNILRNNNLGD